MTENKIKRTLHEVTSNLPNWEADGVKARWKEKPELFIEFSPDMVNNILDMLPSMSLKTYIRESLKSFANAFRR